MTRIIFLFITFLLLASCRTGVRQKKHILRKKQKPVLTYNAAFIPSPKEDSPWYGRSGFIHPLYTPSGKIVTEAFPEDHMHHHGLMFAWTSGVVDGEKVDFWNSQRQQGKVEHLKTVVAEDGKIVVKLRHLDLTGEFPEVVLLETWEIAVVDHPLMNVFDFKSTQVCVLPKGLAIEPYRYGALCVRGKDSWLKNGYKILSSDGDDRLKTKHKQPLWTAMSGVVDGQECGLAVIQHKENFRFPQHVRAHPKMPYFSYLPMVKEGFQLENGKPYVTKFRFAVFDGQIDSQELGAISEGFNN